MPAAVKENRPSHFRTPDDGKPYYCTTCGRNWMEFVMCTLDVHCELETEAAAQARAASQKGDANAKEL